MIAGAAVTRNQIAAIMEAQWRSVCHRLPRITKGNIALAAALGVFWYGLFVAVAFGAAALASDPDSVRYLSIAFSAGLLVAFLYWQVVPLLTASTGSSLELPKLIVYPVPARSLFGIEVLLRLSTGVEILIVLLGAAIGCLRNPHLPKWAPAGFLLFVVFNVLLAAGIRDALNRLFARRYVRELAVLMFVLLAAIPQTSMLLAHDRRIVGIVRAVPLWFLPWTACAHIAAGRADAKIWAVIAVWIAAAGAFGRWQFGRSMREVELGRPQLEGAGTGRRFSWLLNWPSAVFRDPIAGLVEKEIRILARAPRFRLAFIMGFSFGLLIWAPMAFRNGTHSWMRQNFLVVVMAYAVMLLADVLYWNIFGVDRAAAQTYFIFPIPLRSVILAKNVASAFFTLLDVGIVFIVCLVIHLPLTPLQVAESIPACLLIGIYLLAVGNVASAYSPRAADLSQAFRRTTGVKAQWIGLVAFLFAGIPISMAWLARFAFDNEWAFFGVIALMLAVGGYVYTLSVETAERVLRERREITLDALTRFSSPILG